MREPMKPLKSIIICTGFSILSIMITCIVLIAISTIIDGEVQIGQTRIEGTGYENEYYGYESISSALTTFLVFGVCAVTQFLFGYKSAKITRHVASMPIGALMVIPMALIITLGVILFSTMSSDGSTSHNDAIGWFILIVMMLGAIVVFMFLPTMVIAGFLGAFVASKRNPGLTVPLSNNTQYGSVYTNQGFQNNGYMGYQYQQYNQNMNYQNQPYQNNGYYNPQQQYTNNFGNINLNKDGFQGNVDLNKDNNQ